MEFNKIHIIQEGRNVQIFLDETEVKGVRAFEVESEWDGIPIVRLEIATTSLEYERDDKDENPS